MITLRRQKPLLFLLLSLVSGLIVSFALSPVQAYVNFPALPDTYVNDLAQVLDDSQREQVRSQLQAFHQRTNQQVLLVTINSYQDHSNEHASFEAFARDLFNHRGVGSRWRNDGVMLLVAPGDRKVRIQLGSAYGSGWNSRMQAVIDNNMLPDFRRGQLGQGIIKGVGVLLNTLQTGELTNSGSSVPATGLFSFLSSFVVFPGLFIGIFFIGIFFLLITILGLRLAAKIAPSNFVQSGDRSRASHSNDDDDRYYSYTSDDTYSSYSDSDSFSSSSDEGGQSSGGGAEGSW
ncbi:hypothetical protein NIES2134_110570 [Thermostichus vulcanus NIES-2134]|nr:hypothetical protein NIES2134_110570 [Thermostichus vulcanus NIES-2134]